MKLGFFIVGYKGIQFLEKISVVPEYVVTYDSGGLETSCYESIIKHCHDNNILCLNRKDVHDGLYEVDKIFVIGWQYMFHSHLEKMVVFHDSDLPNLRGWCPTPTRLIMGEGHLGATAFQPTHDVDWGRMYDSKVIPIAYPIRLKEALDYVVDMYIEMAENIILGRVKLGNYPSGDSTYSIWRDRQDMFIDWHCSAYDILRKIDALGFPLEGALTKYKGDEIRVLKAKIVDRPNNFIDRHAGKIWTINDNEPVVICGDGLLLISSAFYESNNEMVKFNRLKVRIGE